MRKEKKFREREKESVRSRSLQADVWEDRDGGRNLAAGVGGEGRCITTRSRTAMLMRNTGAKRSNVLKN